MKNYPEKTKINKLMKMNKHENEQTYENEQNRNNRSTDTNYKRTGHVKLQIATQYNHTTESVLQQN